MKTQAAFKRILVGRPMASGELGHTLLPKTIALPVFSSDALSSVAYATGEIILVLGVVGAAAVANVVPISIAVAALLAIVVLSYRQTVAAYPNGGGAYIVSYDNLGMYPGLLAAAALLLDYVLTVSVSTVAGVDALVSSAPQLADYKVPLGIFFVLLVALANLRGVRESGTFFALPTYGFILCMYVLLGTGLIKCLGGCPVVDTPEGYGGAAGAVTLLLVLKAFSAGTTALTGVEAISNGVTAFRYPQSKNAAMTLVIMGSISISLFIGTSWLARSTEVVFTHTSERTVIAQMTAAIFGEGLFFFVINALTAAILFLAANTAYAGFPNLTSILAVDRFLPRQLMNRGDRLVFSNGVIILTFFACLLIVIFDATLNHLIQLYLVGVFISFTLSQAGMVVHWRKSREKGWRRSAAINGFGATLTAVVLIVVIQSKFLEGAYVVIAAIPVMIYAMRSVHRHYTELRAQLAHPERVPADRRPGHQHMVILVERVDAATARAVGYARSVRPADLHAVAFDDSVQDEWAKLAPQVELAVIPTGESRKARLKKHLRSLRKDLGRDDFLTLVVPEMLQSKGLWQILRQPGLQRLKASFLREPGIQVLDVPLDRSEAAAGSGAHRSIEPARNYVLVLVAGVHNATLQAIEYAETLRPTDLRAVSFGLDPAATERLGNDWLASGIPHPLEIDDSPFRDIGGSLIDYVHRFKPDGVKRVVTVVMPEFIVSKRRHQLLHGQTALIIKSRLLFERGVVAVSVPYHIED
ncbi:MAG TPA: APC family permease [Actinomycetota bacterium]|nr:APC family permease [Actinomycetota bacterium]